MPRPTGTQTRSFTYSGNYLTSATNPENGTVNYTYNSYYKVATRTVNAAQVSQAASSVVIDNGVTSGANFAVAIYGNSLALNASVALYGNETVAQFFAANPGTVAVSQAPGNNVYINAAWVNGLSILDQEALLLHELIHNITGNVDPTIQGQLGIPITPISKNIAERLARDCLQ
jgi:hypothetical protein